MTAAYHPQSNGKAEHLSQTIKGSIRKNQVMLKQVWGRVLQTEASVYRMVPHEATGMFPILMLYGREPLLLEKIKHTRYGSDVDYIKTRGGTNKDAGHKEQALEKNAASIEKSWKYFNWKYVKKTVPYSFFVGDNVLMNMKQWLSVLKNVGVCWIGPCTIEYERPSKL